MTNTAAPSFGPAPPTLTSSAYRWKSKKLKNSFFLRQTLCLAPSSYYNMGYSNVGHTIGTQEIYGCGWKELDAQEET